MNQFAMKMMLQQLGVSADFANHGEEAVMRARESNRRACCGPYQLIILDISMPVMDGYSAAAAIRDILGNAGTAIIGATGFSKNDIFGRAQQAGMLEVLTKPIEIETLQEQLNNYVL